MVSCHSFLFKFCLAYCDHNNYKIYFKHLIFGFRIGPSLEKCQTSTYKINYFFLELQLEHVPSMQRYELLIKLVEIFIWIRSAWTTDKKSFTVTAKYVKYSYLQLSWLFSSAHPVLPLVWILQGVFDGSIQNHILVSQDFRKRDILQSWWWFWRYFFMLQRRSRQFF